VVRVAAGFGAQQCDGVVGGLVVVAKELGRVRLEEDELRAARRDIGVDVTPHDFGRTVATQAARGTSLANATALLGHADEATTARHYVQRIHVALDVRVVIDDLVSQASKQVPRKGNGE
jgi:integrase